MSKSLDSSSRDGQISTGTSLYFDALPSTRISANPYAKRAFRNGNVLWSVAILVLIMEAAERLSYYGINQGLRNFMTDKLGWSLVVSTSLKSVWTSLCYLTPVLGAWLADEKWGRYRVILVFGVWYIIGEALIALSSHPHLLEKSPAFSEILFIVGLFGGIGVGTGAIKSCVYTFGADQFNPENPNELKQRGLFSSTFYWCINVGAVVSYGYLSTVCVNGGGILPKEYGYFGLFVICTVAMIASLLVFVSGHSRYVHTPTTESALRKLFGTIWTAAKYSVGAKGIVGGFFAFVLSFILTGVAAFVPAKNFPAMNQVLTLSGGCMTLIGMVSWVVFGRKPIFMDNCKVSRGGSLDDQLANDIKQVIRILPFAAFQIMWNCCYDQVDSNFQSITQQCDLRVGESGRQVPGPVLGAFSVITIVVIIPILDYVIYPAYTKIFKQSPSPFGKVLAGLLVALVAMLSTSLLEIARRNADVLLDSNGQPMLAEGGNQPMNNISWLYAIPQYVLIGAAECLVNVTAMDLFYSNVPAFLRSTCASINLFMVAMGASTTAFFTLAFEKYLPDNLNDGNLEIMFSAIAVISTLNIIAYVWCMVTMQFGMNSRPQATAAKADLR